MLPEVEDSRLHNFLRAQQRINDALFQQLQEKMDRYELFEVNQIIEGKANQVDLQAVVQQMVNMPTVKDRNRLINMLNESALASHARTSERASIENDELNDRSKTPEQERVADEIGANTIEIDGQLSSINANEQQLNQSALRDALTLKAEFTATPDNRDAKVFHDRFEQLQEQVNATVQSFLNSAMNEMQAPNQQSLKHIDVILNAKLEGKANKASVANALHRKANKADVSETFKQLKAQVDKLGGQLQQVSTRVIAFEEIGPVVEKLTNKVERLEKKRKEKRPLEEMTSVF